MRRAMMWVSVVLVAASQDNRATGQDVVPISGFRQRPTVAPLCCPPPVIGYPGCPPGVMPGTPGVMPGTPGVPGSVPGTPGMPPGMTPEGMPPDAVPPSPLDGLGNPFAQPTEGGGQAARTFNANFDGDFGGIFYERVEIVGFTTVSRVVGFTPRVVGNTQTVTVDPQGNKVVTNTPVIVNDPIVEQQQEPIRRVVRLPLAARYQGVQITDNDNPRPVDRVYFGYNFYSDVGASLNPGLGGGDLQRQMFGFEKTFLSGDASFGMRLPFVQQYGPGTIESQQVGDLSLLSKFALYNNRQTGDLISVGFMLTTPTGGGDAILIDGLEAPNSWLFQPWAGFITMFDRTYFQGITSVIVPSNSQDPTLFNNSLAVGYWLYRNPGDRLLTGIIPHAEIHVRNPLDHRDPNGAVFLMDQANLTTGVHFRFARAVLTGAVCVPLAGPRPYSIEAMAFLNYNF